MAFARRLIRRQRDRERRARILDCQRRRHFPLDAVDQVVDRRGRLWRERILCALEDQFSAPAARTARPGSRNHCSTISPRLPTTSSRTTLFCFGDGPLRRGALIVHDASSVAMISLAIVHVAIPQSSTAMSLCTRLPTFASTETTSLAESHRNRSIQ